MVQKLLKRSVVIGMCAELPQQSCTACDLKSSCSSSSMEPFFWEVAFIWKENQVAIREKVGRSSDVRLVHFLKN